MVHGAGAGGQDVLRGGYRPVVARPAHPLTEALFHYNKNQPEKKPTCTQAPSSQITCDDEKDDEALCKIVNDFCPVLTVFLGADIDTDLDGTPDSFSLLLDVEATTAQIEGVF